VYRSDNTVSVSIHITEAWTFDPVEVNGAAVACTQVTFLPH